MNYLLGADGLMDFLTVLPPSQIYTGIEYVRSETEEGQYKQELDVFWMYFLKTYMRKSDHHKEKGSASFISLYLYLSLSLSLSLSLFSLLSTLYSLLSTLLSSHFSLSLPLSLSLSHTHTLSCHTLYQDFTSSAVGT
jgi:hypothetical protein